MTSFDHSALPKTLVENCEKCIHVATHDLLKHADWTSNQLIVDMIQKTPPLLTHALKVIKERLDNKKPHIRTLTVQLLYMIVESCHFSRMYVSEPAFMKFLLHTLPGAIRKPTKKYLFGGGYPNDVVELNYCDLTLLILKKWAMEFHKEPRLHGFTDAYRKLCADGAKFPDETQVELYQITILSQAEREERINNNKEITPQELAEYHKMQYAEQQQGVKQDYSAFNKYRDGTAGKNDFDKKTIQSDGNRQMPAQTQMSLTNLPIEYVKFPPLEQIRFKDSKRAIELAAVIIDTINSYSPLDIPGYTSHFTPGATTHPRNDEGLRNIYGEVAMLLEAVRGAIDSGQIKEDHKVKELSIVHQVLHLTIKYYTQIFDAQKVPGQVLRSGQEGLYQAYKQTYQQQHASAQQQQQQQQRNRAFDQQAAAYQANAPSQQQQRPPTGSSQQSQQQTQSSFSANYHAQDMHQRPGSNGGFKQAQYDDFSSVAETTTVSVATSRPPTANNNNNNGRPPTANQQQQYQQQQYQQPQTPAAGRPPTGQQNWPEQVAAPPASQLHLQQNFQHLNSQRPVSGLQQQQQQQPQQQQQYQQQSRPPTASQQQPQQSRPPTASQQRPPTANNQSQQSRPPSSHNPNASSGFQPSLGSVPTLGENTVRRGQRGQSVSNNNNNNTMKVAPPQQLQQQQQQQTDLTAMMGNMNINPQQQQPQQQQFQQQPQQQQFHQQPQQQQFQQQPQQQVQQQQQQPQYQQQPQQQQYQQQQYQQQQPQQQYQQQPQYQQQQFQQQQPQYQQQQQPQQRPTSNSVDFFSQLYNQPYQAPPPNQQSYNARGQQLATQQQEEKKKDPFDELDIGF